MRTFGTKLNPELLERLAGKLRPAVRISILNEITLRRGTGRDLDAGEKAQLATLAPEHHQLLYQEKK